MARLKVVDFNGARVLVFEEEGRRSAVNAPGAAGYLRDLVVGPVVADLEAIAMLFDKISALENVVASVRAVLDRPAVKRAIDDDFEVFIGGPWLKK